MFGRRWRLFRLCGIPVALDASWLIILALLTFSIASLFPSLMRQYFGDAAQDLPSSAYWLMGLTAAVAFFGCILLHELGHALVGRARGMPIRGITLFLFGGVAEMEEEPPSAATEFLMAIAGPIVSVILGVGFALLTGIGSYGGWPPPVLMVLGYLAAINLLVLVFNLIPAFPLDGGRVLRSILWATIGDLRRATLWASRAGQAFAWLLMFWGIMQFFSGNWLGGIWTGLIGLFLNNAAQSSYQQVLIRQALQGEPVRRFMNRELITVTISPDADALDALGRMRRTGSSRLLVVERGQLIGMVSLKDLLRFLSLKIGLDDTGPAAPESDSEFRLPEQPDRRAVSEQHLHHAGNGRGHA